MFLHKKIYNSHEVLILLFCIIAVLSIITSYSNSFNCSWHMDDYTNILYNKTIHIESLNYSEIVNAVCPNDEDEVYSWYGKCLYRPVSLLSFSLNWFLSKDNVFMYHIVNFIIHLINFCLLVAINMIVIGNSKYLHSSRFKYAPYSAVLAALIWALNPIHTQAVTYIVQRMALLSCLFVLLTLLFYLLGRTCIKSRFSILFFCFSLIFWIFSMLSKENSIVLPLALLYCEYTIFDNKYIRTLFSKRNSRIYILLFFGFSLIIFEIYLFGDLLEMYQNRSFTMYERLVTQFRVLLYYLSLIFFPYHERLSFEHDFSVSSGIFSPITTLGSALLIIIIIYLAIKNSQKSPIVSFSILFFFIFQITESTFWPLEIIFEHRNYLPSIFLFLPITNYFIFKYRCSSENRIYKKLLIISSILLVWFYSYNTYHRNKIWATESSLWMDAYGKSPNRARAIASVAKYKYELNNDYSSSIEFYLQSIGKDSDTDIIFHDRWVYSKVGRTYLYLELPHEALNYLMKALSLYQYPQTENDEYIKLIHAIIAANIKIENWNEAYRYLLFYIQKDSITSYDQNLYKFVKEKHEKLQKSESATSHQ